jgi:D-beta-D-heptose 7-phosphate kinase/D-beta-D-heptose 1-phosphate adenosyltransferase
VHIVVAGDVMLDEYLLGAASRISPEAPVPVVEIKERRYVAGGAANVAANVVSLGGRCTLVGICGQDKAGDSLRAILDGNGVGGAGLLSVPGRPTTCKSRVVAGQQQIVRFDVEEREALPEEINRELCRRLEHCLSNADICVLSDYGKGVLSHGICRRIIELAKDRSVPVLADPKGLRFEKYHGCALITPNQREVARFTGILTETEADVIAAGNSLLASLPGSAVLVTRGPDGMTLFREGQAPMTIPTVARNVYDVVGAGDTVMAALSVSLGAGLAFPEAMHIANIAAGIAVGKQGTVAVTFEELVNHPELVKFQEVPTDASENASEAHLYSKT